jgi:hypothetical protein
MPRSMRTPDERIAAIRHAATYAFPVADIEQMLEEMGSTAYVMRILRPRLQENVSADPRSAGRGSPCR